MEQGEREERVARKGRYVSLSGLRRGRTEKRSRAAGLASSCHPPLQARTGTHLVHSEHPVELIVGHGLFCCCRLGIFGVGVRRDDPIWPRGPKGNPRMFWHGVLTPALIPTTSPPSCCSRTISLSWHECILSQQRQSRSLSFSSETKRSWAGLFTLCAGVHSSPLEIYSLQGI